MQRGPQASRAFERRRQAYTRGRPSPSLCVFHCLSMSTALLTSCAVRAETSEGLLHRNLLMTLNMLEAAFSYSTFLSSPVSRGCRSMPPSQTEIMCGAHTLINERVFCSSPLPHALLTMSTSLISACAAEVAPMSHAM